jgi:GMP synthase PP-ATPase subunit
MAIRTGEVTSERLASLREADAIVLEERKKVAGRSGRPLQSAAYQNGHMGDERTYEMHCPRPDSLDAMIADWTRLPKDFLVCRPTAYK